MLLLKYSYNYDSIIFNVNLYKSFYITFPMTDFIYIYIHQKVKKKKKLIYCYTESFL